MRGVKWAMLLLPLLLFTACGRPTEQTHTWKILPTADYHQQILREGEAAADIRLAGLEFDSAEAAALNETLARMQEERLDYYIAYAEQVLAEAEFNEALQQRSVYYALNADLSLFFEDGQTLSLLSEVYEHVSGAAHPMTYRYGYNFDAATGQRLTLADIWGEEARESVAKQIYAQVEQDGKLDDYYPGLAENLLRNWTDENWYMDDKNIYIIYNPYEIAPYAAGILVFELPLDAPQG